MPNAELYQLDETLDLLGERLQRVLNAVALTLDARRAIDARLRLATDDQPPDGIDVALFGMSAARCRELVKLLASA